MPAARYDIIRQLACGGMAEVLLARRTPDDGGPNELVVIKRVLQHLTQADGFMRMFATESRIASQLRHPNIVAVLEVGEMDALPFIAMERLDGADLLRLLQQCVLRRQQLGAAVAMAVVSGAARGLGYAHRARARDGRPLKIIHRDVSPHNIFVTRDGGVKLLDFGIAKSAAQATNTHTGQVKGKISYMSPEQIRAKPLDARSDLWSLGVVLWESVAGEKLFTRDNDAATLHAILHDPIPTLAKPDAPGLDELIGQILQRDPTKRIATAEDIAQRLDALLARSTSANTAKLIAQRVASLVPALSPEIDAARPAVQRNPEVVTFAVGPAFARAEAPRESRPRESLPGPADRAGAHRRLSIADAPVREQRPSEEDDPTLMEIAAPPPDADFDPEETVERDDRAHPRVGETTDTHTIPLRPAIQATGTLGVEPVAVARAMASAGAGAPRAMAAVQPRRPVLPASIDVIQELSAEFEPESDDSLTAPLRRPPTLAMPPDRAPHFVPPKPPPRAGGPSPLNNPLTTKPAKATQTAPPAVRSSPPARASSPPATASSPPASRPSSAPAVRPMPAEAPRPSAAPEAPRVSAVHEAARPSRPSSPAAAGGADLASIFGAPPPPPASPFGDIPALHAPAPTMPPQSHGPRDTLAAAEVPATGPRRTQRFNTTATPRKRGGILAVAFGGLCLVAGMVVLGAYFSGSLRRAAPEAATASALQPSPGAPVAPAVPVAAPAPPAVAPPAPPAPAPAPQVAAAPEPEPAPEVMTPEPEPPPAPVAAPRAPAPRPAQVAARAPVAPRAAPPRAPTPPRAPAPTVAARPRPATRTTLLNDPFDTLANGSAPQPSRAPVRATPVRALVAAPTRAPVVAPTRAPVVAPRRVGPPPSVRGGSIFQDL